MYYCHPWWWDNFDGHWTHGEVPIVHDDRFLVQTTIDILFKVLDCTTPLPSYFKTSCEKSGYQNCQDGKNNRPWNGNVLVIFRTFAYVHLFAICLVLLLAILFRPFYRCGTKWFTIRIGGRICQHQRLILSFNVVDIFEFIGSIFPGLFDWTLLCWSPGEE